MKKYEVEYTATFYAFFDDSDIPSGKTAEEYAESLWADWEIDLDGHETKIDEVQQ